MLQRKLLFILLALVSVTLQAEEITSEKIDGSPTLGLGQYDLNELGYTVDEFFYSGSANSYKPTAPLTNNGNWEVTSNETTSFKTRLVVVRPVDPEHFNGTVITEWFNVSGGVDAPPLWGMSHREIIRSGYVYVGVSAQKVGVEGGGYSIMGTSNPLKKSNPERYGSLLHPGDAFSYDIFSAAGALIKNSANNGLMGPLTPTRVLAMGESQSAVFLTTYINAIDPIAKIFDGFIVDSRFGSAASLESAGMRSEDSSLNAVKFRDNLRVPIINVITETDLLSRAGLPPYYPARQNDNNRLRTWEIAGAAHADTYIFAVNNIDSGNAPIALLARLYGNISMQQMGLTKPINSGPQHHLVIMSALHHLNRWVRDDTLPPTAKPLQVADDVSSDGFFEFVHDEHGLAKGGVRSPWVDVPVAVLSGLGNEGGALARLVGVTEPFDEATLKRLYPGGKADYIAKFKTALNEAVSAGFILPADQSEMIELAQFMYPVQVSE